MPDILFMLLLLSHLSAASEPAADEPSAPASPDCGTCGAEPPPIDLGGAEAAEDLSKKQLRKLKPTRTVLSVNPRGQTDYTAYTLEWGEVEAGLTYITVGVLPGLQVSTIPAFYLPPALSQNDAAPLAPIWNVQGKLDVLRLGPLDIAPTGSYASLDWPELDARFYSLGATASIVIVPAWSIHAGGTWSSLGVKGVITTDWLTSVIAGVSGSTAQFNPTNTGDGLGVNASLEAMTLNVSTDVRFNRRDSLILQAQGLIWTDAHVATSIESGEKSATLLEDQLSGFVNPAEAYVATLSYQATFRNVDLRVGIGVPFNNPAWALQAFEFAYRFGGPTRTHERHMLKGYRHNRKADDAVADVAEAPKDAQPGQ